jgi:hypothetical protein
LIPLCEFPLIIIKVVDSFKVVLIVLQLYG